MRQFCKISVLGGMVCWEIVSVLTKFWESYPGILIRSNGISLSWNILCVLTKSWRSSWKIWSALTIFFPPGKSYVFLYNFQKVLLESFTCVLVSFLFLLENLMFSYYIQASWKIWCVLEISLKKSLFGKKNKYFSKIAQWLLLP